MAEQFLGLGSCAHLLLGTKAILLWPWVPPAHLLLECMGHLYTQQLGPRTTHTSSSGCDLLLGIQEGIIKITISTTTIAISKTAISKIAISNECPPSILGAVAEQFLGLGPCAHLLLGRMGLVGPHAHLSSSGCDLLLLLLLLLGIGVSCLGLWFEI